MPNGTKPLKFRYYIRSSSSLDAPVAQFIKGWMQDIGIKVDVKVVSEDELTPIENAGTFDFATWAWMPFTDPDAQLSYLTCDAARAGARRWLLQRRLLLLEAYDALYAKQRGELDETKRIDDVKQMQQIFYDDAPYVVLFSRRLAPGLQQRQVQGLHGRARPGGPVMVANDFLNYMNVEAAGGGSDSGASTTVLIIVGIVVALASSSRVVLMMNRRRSADLRELTGSRPRAMSLRFVGRKIVGSILTLFVVLVFNFFLFRIVEERPRRRCSSAARTIPPEVKARSSDQFGLDKSKWEQFWRTCARRCAGNLGISYRTGPAGDRARSRTRSGRRCCWSACRPSLSTVIGLLLGIKAGWQRNSAFDRRRTGASMVTYAMPDFFLGHAPARVSSRSARAVPDRRHRDPRRDCGGISRSSTRRKHSSSGADAHARLHR